MKTFKVKNIEPAIEMSMEKGQMIKKHFVHIHIESELGEILRATFPAKEANQIADYIKLAAKNSLPPGVSSYGAKFRSEIKVNRKTVYLGLFATVEDAVNAQTIYRKENNLPEPIRGRPWKAEN